eukprot:Sspe_Gene.40049::Locus_19305_Transcript_1_1_Confidence_1.000_Length_2951::g.40049::m.40049
MGSATPLPLVVLLVLAVAPSAQAQADANRNPPPTPPPPSPTPPASSSSTPPPPSPTPPPPSPTPPPSSPPATSPPPSLPTPTATHGNATFNIDYGKQRKGSQVRRMVLVLVPVLLGACYFFLTIRHPEYIASGGPIAATLRLWLPRWCSEPPPASDKGLLSSFRLWLGGPQAEYVPPSHTYDAHLPRKREWWQGGILGEDASIRNQKINWVWDAEGANLVEARKETAGSKLKTKVKEFFRGKETKATAHHPPTARRPAAADDELSDVPLLSQPEPTPPPLRPEEICALLLKTEEEEELGRVRQERVESEDRWLLQKQRKAEAKRVQDRIHWQRVSSLQEQEASARAAIMDEEWTGRLTVDAESGESKLSAMRLMAVRAFEGDEGRARQRVAAAEAGEREQLAVLEGDHRLLAATYRERTKLEMSECQERDANGAEEAGAREWISRLHATGWLHTVQQTARTAVVMEFTADRVRMALDLLQLREGADRGRVATAQEAAWQTTQLAWPLLEMMGTEGERRRVIVAEERRGRGGVTAEASYAQGEMALRLGLRLVECDEEAHREEIVSADEGFRCSTYSQHLHTVFLLDEVRERRRLVLEYMTLMDQARKETEALRAKEEEERAAQALLAVMESRRALEEGHLEERVAVEVEQEAEWEGLVGEASVGYQDALERQAAREVAEAEMAREVEGEEELQRLSCVMAEGREFKAILTEYRKARTVAEALEAQRAILTLEGAVRAGMVAEESSERDVLLADERTSRIREEELLMRKVAKQHRLASLDRDGEDGEGAEQVTQMVVATQGAVVRAGQSLKSAQVASLDQGVVIDVVAVKGYRARIVSPVSGWISVRSQLGTVICRPLTDKDTSMGSATSTPPSTPKSEASGRATTSPSNVSRSIEKGWKSLTGGAGALASSLGQVALDVRLPGSVPKKRPKS